MNVSVKPSPAAVDEIGGYKPFIDGLRAVSILAVLGYHVGLPGFSGGFVGVDVFFVISGFLIINQIRAGLMSGTFSFGGFYARRTLRILPPFLLVFVATLVAAPLVLVGADEFRSFEREVIYAAAMAINHHLFNQQGYLDITADARPLLHIWSLAVEEQFYLVAPLVGLATVAWGRRSRWGIEAVWRGGTIALLVISFAACVLFTWPRKNPAFYFMPLRAWEFVAGGAAALLVPPARMLSSRTVLLVAMLGLAAIAAAVVLFSDSALYPSYRAALPVAGAVAVIVAGLACPGNAVARALSAQPMIWLGRFSYAWYLWHWPLLSYSRIWDFGQRDLLRDSLLALVALVLAAVTHFAVERPMRRLRDRWRGRRAWGVVAVGIVLAVVVGVTGFAAIRDVRLGLAATQPAGISPPGVPATSLDAARSRGLLMGDSHAGRLAHQVIDRGSGEGAYVALANQAGCLALEDVVMAVDWMPAETCTQFAMGIAATATERLKSIPSFLIVAQRWNIYADTPHRPETFDGLRQGLMSGGKVSRGAASFELLAEALHRTLSAWQARGVKRVLLIGPIPEFPVKMVNCLLRAQKRDLPVTICQVPREPVDERRRQMVDVLHSVAARFDDVRFIDPIDLFCDAQFCRPHDGARAVYTDDDHLNDAGAEMLYRAFEADFRWAFSGR